ncbi:hypothetical protein C8039_04005 [Halogeometricum sp. wsp3]|nr:hypothetical protein C8039_04005 [Halogeometricum sp. wsp3]
MTDELVAAEFEEIQSSVETLVARDTVTDKKRSGNSPITGTTEMDDLADADLVVEAVTEDMDVKRSYSRISKPTWAGRSAGENTSTLSITTIAVRPTDPNRSSDCTS